MISRFVLAASFALAAAPALAATATFSFSPTYQSLYSTRMTAEPVADGADTSLSRRDQFAVMTEDFARAEAARADAAKQQHGSSAVAGKCER